jgi:hypothetical protein
VIYFDAFANDHVDDGFLALTAEVVGLSRLQKKTSTAVHKRFLKSAARVGGILLRTGTRMGVKAARSSFVVDDRHCLIPREYQKSVVQIERGEIRGIALGCRSFQLGTITA